MSTLQRTIDMFEDTSEIASIKQDFLLLFSSTEKVRRGCFGKVDAYKKAYEKDLAIVQERLDRIERYLNLEAINEKINVNDPELPLLQYSQRTA